MCEKLRAIFCNGQPWASCHQEVTKKYTELMRLARKFYNEKDDASILMEFVKYTAQDLADVFHVEQK